VTEAARIRELMLENLFSVFGERAPERRSEAIARNYTDDVAWTDRDLGLLAFNLGVPEEPPAAKGIDVALVRDGRIAVLHTLLTGQD